MRQILIVWLIAIVPAAAATEVQVSKDLVTELHAFADIELEAAAAIGTRIRLNETGERESWLITWLPSEQHLSLGIGHFIWLASRLADARGHLRSWSQPLSWLSTRLP